jgi:hypothetical protein
VADEKARRNHKKKTERGYGEHVEVPEGGREGIAVLGVLHRRLVQRHAGMLALEQLPRLRVPLWESYGRKRNTPNEQGHEQVQAQVHERIHRRICKRLYNQQQTEEVKECNGGLRRRVEGDVCHAFREGRDAVEAQLNISI